MTAARDVDRLRVYRAEADAFGHTLLDESVDVRGLCTLAGILFADAWWIGVSGAAVPRVRSARRDAMRSSAAFDGSNGWTIRIAPGHDQPPTLSHEAAHVLVGAQRAVAVPAHGARFRAAHLAVATVLFGSHGHRLLEAAYRAAELDFEPRPPWTAPVAADEHGVHGRWRRAIAL